MDRKLFLVADIQDLGYWVAKIQSDVVVHPFIVAYGYRENIEKLIRLYRAKESPYKNWVFPINLEFDRGTDKNAPPERRVMRSAPPNRLKLTARGRPGASARLPARAAA